VIRLLPGKRPELQPNARHADGPNVGSRRPRLAILVLLLTAWGCGRTQDELVLPWCKYRTVIGPGGSGIWSGASHTEVLTRRWWGWSTVFDGNAAPGRPVIISSTAVLVMSSGVARFLRASDSTSPLACGIREAIASVPPKGGFVDCVDHLAGPAPAIATLLRVRRIDPLGQTVAQQEFAAGDAGRVFLTPSILFYDDEGTPYLVTFRDPWAEETPDGSRRTGRATPEQLQQITCELIAVGPNPRRAIPAPAGLTVADCSTAEVWSHAIGQRLRDPWKS
jgi:hypothetical protein